MKANSNITRRAGLVSLAAPLLLPLAAGAADQPGVLTAKEVRTLMESAKTPDDHRKLARHFAAKAAQHEAEAKEHEAMAATYKRMATGHDQKHPMSPETAAHCEYYAQHCRKAAAELRKMAEAHEAMAKMAK